MMDSVSRSIITCGKRTATGKGASRAAGDAHIHSLRAERDGDIDMYVYVDISYVIVVGMTHT